MLTEGALSHDRNQLTLLVNVHTFVTAAGSKHSFARYASLADTPYRWILMSSPRRLSSHSYHGKSSLEMCHMITNNIYWLVNGDVTNWKHRNPEKKRIRPTLSQHTCRLNVNVLLWLNPRCTVSFEVPVPVFGDSKQNVTIYEITWISRMKTFFYVVSL